MAKEVSKTREWEGAFTAFEEGYKQIRKNPQPAVLFVGVYTVLTIISLIIQGKSSAGEMGYINYQDILLLFFVLPLTAYGLALADKKLMSTDKFMELNWRKLVMLWVVSILAALIFIGSLILLIVPIIWTLAWFALCIYWVVDKGLSPFAALQESKRISEKHKAKVWGVIGVSILVSIVAGVVSLIPYVGAAAVAFSMVLTSAASARLFRWLQKQG